MTPIEPCPLPEASLLQRYASSGAYTDCFAADIAAAVTHEQYVAAFYTTFVFKTERLILKYAVKRPSTDEQARQLAAGSLGQFAAWSVEQRAGNQLLMCDMFGSTRSWLMVEPLAAGTRLYFGSAVVPKAHGRNGAPAVGLQFRALMGFHTLYSRVLLRAARARLAK
jgi:hypothetical protein